MSKTEKLNEEQVFKQELDDKEMVTVTGGMEPNNPNATNSPILNLDPDTDNCVQSDHRDIYGGDGFPNCAASVEDGSYCRRNDACTVLAVNYKNMTDCWVSHA